MVLRKSFYIHWSAGRSPRVHEVNPGRDPSIWLSETPLMAKTLQPYPKQSIISELHELTFQSVFGSLRATFFSWFLLYICIPISYGSLPIGINSFG